jgi:mono/diheme cytochrome c family protein
MRGTAPIRNLESGIQNSRHEFTIPNSKFLIPVLTLVLSIAAGAQESGKSVADGVYTDAQAARGATVYDAACAGCHRTDLGGGTGPALRDERFAREFAGKDLKTLFTKTATTMPRGAPGSLGDNVYLDVVAHLLKENGFPSGVRELTADGLDGVRVVPGRPKPPPPIGDFSYVDVVGCLAAGPQNTWMLTQGSAPVIAGPAASASSPPAAVAAPLGAQTFSLLDAMAYAPDAHKGQKVHVRGLLIRLPGEQRMTISSLEMVSPTCRE